MNKRVLLTGASGFVGRHALAPLTAAGYEIHAVSSREVARPASSVQWHRADLLEAGAAERLVAAVQPTHLLHFAWYAVHGRYPTAPENLRWSVATSQLLAAFAAAQGRRAVFAGSCFEYDFSYGYCTEDLTPSIPGTFYGVCKNATREMVAGFSRQFGLSTAWGRIFHLFGPFETAGRLVPSVIRAILRGEPARCSHGRQIRDMLHVQDVADAFVALLDSEVPGTVNISSGQPLELRDVINQIASQLGRPDLVRLGVLPARPDDPPLLLANPRKLREAVGWQPRLSLEKGLRQTIAWWRAVESGQGTATR